MVLRVCKKQRDGHTGARTQDHSVISTALYRLSYTTSLRVLPTHFFSRALTHTTRTNTPKQQHEPQHNARHHPQTQSHTHTHTQTRTQQPTTPTTHYTTYTAKSNSPRFMLPLARVEGRLHSPPLLRASSFLHTNHLRPCRWSPSVLSGTPCMRWPSVCRSVPGMVCAAV